MNKPQRIHYESMSLKNIALGLLGVFCLFYSILASDFAELFAIIPGLTFPVFIGEILFFLCIVLLLPYFRETFKPYSFWVGFFIVLYAAWLLSKVYFGFQTYGALALRNAALFYYPGFILIGYAVYNPKWQEEFWRWAGAFVLLSVLYVAPVINYFYISYYALILVLVWSSPKHRLKILVIFLLGLHAVIHGFFWKGSRSHLIGLTLMLIFCVVYYLYGLLKIRTKIKVGLSLGIIGGFWLLLFWLGDHNALTSMLTFKELRKEFRRYNDEIEKQRPFYKPAPLALGLYHENAKMCLDGVWRGPLPKRVYRSRLNIDDHSAREIAKISLNTQTDLLPRPDIKPLVMQTKRSKKVRSSQNQTRENPSIDLLDQHELLHSSLPITHSEKPLPVQESPPNVIVEEQEPLIVNRFTREGDRSLEVAYNNIFFRLFIWRDMWDQIKTHKSWWGVNLGEPQRSPSVEILNWAVIEWRRDGWITPHNSFFHMVYRAGVVGVGCVVIFFGLVMTMSFKFFKRQSITGGFLMANVFYWIGISSFLVILELPYNAIPFWTLLGITLRHLKELEKSQHPS